MFGDTQARLGLVFYVSSVKGLTREEAKKMMIIKKTKNKAELKDLNEES